MGMRLPNLFLLGAPKCGTTWISSVLRENPEIYQTKSKEIHFFDHPDKFEQGVDWYGQFFRDAAKSKWVCDGTPNYLATTLRPEHRMMAEHISDTCPDAHFIISFRNPVDRALSSILHQMRKGTLSPFLDCDHYVDCLLNGTVDDSKQGVLEFGNYAVQLEKYLSLFSRNRFHFLVFEEDIVKNRKKTVHNMFTFLGLDPTNELGNLNKRANPSLRTRGALFIAQCGPKRVALPLARGIEKLVTFPQVVLKCPTREKLWKFYEPMVPILAELLNRNLGVWKANLDE